ncbi:hypothetical protein BBP40_000190 [Aspergillus hancockii]|nr:hypothetical protein BBP40_000190 [Aspergillus hancockii]
MSGNAWAQMKARDREQKGEPDPSDFGCESEKVKESASKPKVLTKLSGGKKRSTTEPPRLADNAASAKVESEKKRSVVATLKSKFSFKELGKEFRKAPDPPLSAMPRLPPNVGSPTSEEDKQSPKSSSFEEKRLHMPKTRQQGSHPSSAPAETTSFRDSERSSQNSVSSLPIKQVRSETEEDYAETFRRAITAHMCKVGNLDPMVRLDTVLIDGSSPMANTGETSRGHPAVVDTEQRFCSMKIEKETSISSKPKPVASSAENPVSYTPSMYDTPKSEAPNVLVSSPCERKQAMREQNYPLIVSSDQHRRSSVKSQGTTSSDQYMRPSTRIREQRAFTSGQAVPAFDATQMRFPYDPMMPIDEPRFFAGVTSHGGYAPAPPLPGYQNTISLEQQVATYMDSIHIHVDGTAHKLARSFENCNNWATDQILRQIDLVSDIMRTLNGRMATEADVVKEMQRVMMEMRAQVNTLQRQQHASEDRLVHVFQSELSKVRDEISALALTVKTVRSTLPYNLTLDTRSGNARLQRSQSGSRWSKDSDRQQQYKKKQRPVKKEEVLTKGTESQRGGEHKQGESVALHKHAENTLSDDVPTPTAAFRTPGIHSDDRRGQFTQPHVNVATLNNTGPISTGYCDPLHNSSVQFKEASHFSPPLVQKVGIEKKSAADKMKFPAKIGIFQPFRRNRDRGDGENNEENRTSPTTQRSKITGISEDQNPKAQVALPSTPPKESASLGVREEDVDPSNIHPTLHTARQQEIMAQRERKEKDVDPSNVHPALRTAHQQEIIAERERELSRMPERDRLAALERVAERDHLARYERLLEIERLAKGNGLTIGERENIRSSQDTMTPRQLLRSSRSYQDLGFRDRSPSSQLCSSHGSPGMPYSLSGTSQDLTRGYPALPTTPSRSGRSQVAQSLDSPSSPYRGATPPPRELKADWDLSSWYRAAYGNKSPEDNH